MKKNKKYRWGLKLATLALSSSVLFSTIDTASAATYTVKSGDSLWKIANQYGVTYQTLMKWNNLSSTTIRVGQKLNLNTQLTSATISTPTPKPTAAPKPTVTVTPKLTTNLVQVAKKQLGVKYTFGGSKPSTGFDCSGYVTYVYNNAGISTARKSAAGFYSSAKKVSSPQVGDLVFFANTYKAGISHVGIYIGNSQMISASDGGVSVANINSSYWKTHFAGYGRI
ncbi:LysM peptidoglycan-binding domain-containing protein [Lysinibacillus sphaericus]|uniref:LysM peptidoglycan-binding domain-containing protein n=1 Tax=Lysinibacillus sphaericus TaxID=1421 RepID=A0A544UMP2_LYSSH|nr:NlpC/P60 family protein [Lysinibacillus sp. SDF0037]TQR35121.1 LysM peptidoglycan-binding domain-containing protein [Lysinibacillus sp. SDF0037]